MVLHVISSLNPKDGGPPSGLKSLVPALNNLGYSNEVACLDNIDSAWLNDYKFQVHALGPSYLNYKLSCEANRWFENNIEKYTFVIIHGIWQYHSVLSQLFCKKFKKNYFIFSHGMLDPWFKSKHPFKHIKKKIYWNFFERKVFVNAKSLLYTSQREGELAAQTFPELQSLKSINVGYGISDLNKNPEELKSNFFRTYPFLKNKNIFLFTGRITRKKGLDVLIPSFINVFKNDPNSTLVIIGPDNENLMPGLMKNASNQMNIHYLGWVQEDIKMGAYASAAIFVLPSHSENWGAVIAEALMFSLPVITTRHINTYELIERYRCGLIADANRRSLTNEFINWVNLPNERKIKMQLRARECFENSFEVIGFAKRLMKLLND